MRMYKFLRQACLLVITSLVLTSCNPFDPLGHISGNVPAQTDFQAYLARDLKSYFGDELKMPVTVSYELLRNAPTQSGLSYPKYYAWVRVFEKGQCVEEGAVRLAAIEQQRFEVTNFMRSDEIVDHSETLKTVFPALLCEKILSLANDREHAAKH
jgi:hypothetical protein